MELKDTVEMMSSSDYEERFKAEYYQLKIRLDKLRAMLKKWDTGELDFEPTTPRLLYSSQVNIMALYLDCLADRAKIENIKL